MLKAQKFREGVWGGGVLVVLGGFWGFWGGLGGLGAYFLGGGGGGLGVLDHAM